jgi:phage-related protein
LQLKPTLSGTPASFWISGRRFDQKSVRVRLQRRTLSLYPFGYNKVVRPIRFLGDSLRCLRDFPQGARHDAGYQLDKVQRGGQPDDFKPMPSIGKGVEEIRVSDSSGAYRVAYFARRAEAVYVLHAFHKKTQATPKKDLKIAKIRFEELLGGKI